MCGSPVYEREIKQTEQETLADGGSDRTSLLRDDHRGATFDSDREYRYILWREWDAEAPTVAFVMLNPSVADEDKDDPTLRRCINYAKNWGYGRLEVVNLFALRSTDPSDLRDHGAPVGSKNDSYLRAACDRAEMVVVAWGANGGYQNRATEVAEMLDVGLYALDTTKGGHPVHPLYQPADIEPEPWGERSLNTDSEQEVDDGDV